VVLAGEGLAGDASVVPLAGLGAAGEPVEPYPSRPDDPAYILYTSGSTGAPKGVCLSHRNARAFVDWAGDLLDIRAGDRLSNHAPFNFDLSVFDLYAAFRAGASVHLVPAEMSYAPAQLVRYLHERELTVWYSVPSAVTLMIRDGDLLTGPRPAGLRVCVVAGEPMPVQYAQALRKAWPGVRLFNWYGPTETNVCTSYEMSDADLAREDPLPIGRASCGDTVVLDEGEVVVSGPTVMLGYWGRPPHQGPYRTGDLARVNADGDLEYVARRDNLVKLRGNRVEPGEIEAVLAAHPAVAEAAVVVVGAGLEAALHAVIVVEAGATRPGLLDLKRWCAERLPTYMIIDAVRVVEQLPLTANGKTDRRALLTTLEGGRS
jgi:clorobiocin biosynthesis protein CloN4